MIITEEWMRRLEAAVEELRAKLVQEVADIRLYVERVVEERINTTDANLEELREYHAGLIVGVQDQVGSLDSDVRRAAELAQGAEYMASDAKRAADEAANTSRRGW